MKRSRAHAAADASRRQLRRGKGAPADVGDCALLGSLAVLLVCASACFGQRNAEPRPAPLDAARGEREGRELVAKLLAQKPEQNVTNTGWVRIRDATGKRREIPARFEVYATPTNWVSVYETLASPDRPGGAKLTVIHTDRQPNRYGLVEPGAVCGTNAVVKALTPEQSMVPFAGSDFWVADLGLEFLHWPDQRVLTYEMRHGKACKVLESVNPQPVPGGYSTGHVVGHGGESPRDRACGGLRRQRRRAQAVRSQEPGEGAGRVSVGGDGDANSEDGDTDGDQV